jgi:DNA-directed RNA polymerase specialized sigma24 family protein
MQSCFGFQATRPSAKASLFQHSIRPHLDSAYSLARWLMADPREADSVVESACIQAFHHLTPMHDHGAKIRLLHVVRNTAHAKIQAKVISDAVFDDPDEEHDGDATNAVAVTGCDRISWITNDPARLHAAVAALPLELRECLVLRDLERLPCKDIAGITASSTSIVRARLYRARQQILASLAKDKISEATMYSDRFIEQTGRPVPPSAVRCL